MCVDVISVTGAKTGAHPTVQITIMKVGDHKTHMT